MSRLASQHPTVHDPARRTIPANAHRRPSPGHFCDKQQSSYLLASALLHGGIPPAASLRRAALPREGLHKRADSFLSPHRWTQQ
eukprot:4982342-Pyramimonas_sp.AAC.1